MKKLYNIVVLLILSTSVYAQDVRKDLLSLNQRYEQMSKFSAKVDVKAYNKNGDIISKSSASILKNGAQIKYTYNESVILYNPDYILQINNDQKEININILEGEGKKKKEKELKEKMQLIPNLDSALNKLDSLSYIGETDGLKCYALYNSKSMINITYLHLDKNGLIARVEYRYSMEKDENIYNAIVKFTEVTENPVINENEFKLSQYLIINNDGVFPASGYESYYIYNNK